MSNNIISYEYTTMVVFKQTGGYIYGICSTIIRGATPQRQELLAPVLVALSHVGAANRVLYRLSLYSHDLYSNRV